MVADRQWLSDFIPLKNDYLWVIPGPDVVGDQITQKALPVLIISMLYGMLVHFQY